MYYKDRDREAGIHCIAYCIIFAFNYFVGGWSVNYLLSVFAHKIPFFWAGVAGFVVAEVSIPLAIVVSILKHFAVI
jgi:hypothetical protein